MNGPAPFVGVTLTIPLHDVVVSVKAVVPLCDTVTLCVGVPVPAARNARELGARLIDALAPVGTAVAAPVGVAVGPVVGAVVGEAVGMAPTFGEGLDDPPPPQAMRETATTPASTKKERKLWPHTELQAHTSVCLTSHPNDVTRRTPPTWAFRLTATGLSFRSNGQGKRHPGLRL